MKDAMQRLLGRLLFWVGRVFYGYHRLEKLEMVALESPIATAISLYGPPLESKTKEDFPEATEHIFGASPYHEAVIYEWKGVIHSVTYWSSHSDPGRDLQCMLTRFGEGRQWDVLTKGYSFQRDDYKLRLWCSAVPAIGVATIAYQEAGAAYRRAKEAAEPNPKNDQLA